MAITAQQSATAPWPEDVICPKDVVLERGCEENHDLDPDPEAWWISCADITPDTPGAFPITLGLWS